VAAGPPASVPSRPVCPGPVAAGAAVCHSRVVTDRAGTPLVTAAPTGYGPAQFHGAYELPTGATSEQTVAIVDAYDDPTIEEDLAVYSETLGLPECTTANGCFRKVNQEGQEGPYPKEDSGWALEIALDVEVAHAICQDCRILLAEADSSGFGDLGAAVNAAAGMGADVISNSYGSEGEFAGEPAYDAYYEHPGIAITASAGDSGYGAEFPAASPHVIAVGGTTLTLGPSNSYGGETVWSGSGSGCSAYEPAPSWQLLDANWSLTECGAKRGVADVAADAAPSTGASVYDTASKNPNERGWHRVGGTSLSAPLIAAVYALAGGGEGAYPAAGPYAHQEDSPASLHDVTGGSNGSCGETIMCEAAPGYDGPTGVGTPRGLVAFGGPAPEQPLTLRIQEGEGTVVSDPAGIECTGPAGEECTSEFEEGQEVTLTASPAAGYRFFSWGLCPSANGRQCTVTMSEATEVRAKFKKTYDLTIDKGGSQRGVVLNSKNGVTCAVRCSTSTISLFEGAEVTIYTATPFGNTYMKEFTAGTGSTASCDGTAECTFTLEEDSSAEALFEERPKATLSIEKEGGGEAKLEGNGTFCNNSCESQQVEYFSAPTAQEAVIAWELNAGTSSIEWTTGAGTCTGSSEATKGQCKVTMDEAHSLVAKLE